MSDTREKPKATVFAFTSRKLSPEAREAVFRYEIRFADRKPLEFADRIAFPESATAEGIDTALLDAVLDAAHLMLGVSYYKLYCPPEIETAQTLSEDQANFWNIVYRKGLGEFCYRNDIDPRSVAKFPYEADTNERSYRLRRTNRSLVGIGGGKDSIVAREILKENNEDIAGLLVETVLGEPRGDAVAEAVADTMDIPMIRIRRFLDESMKEDFPGSYNGHIPISGVFAVLGYLVALLLDYSRVIVANEASSSVGNMTYRGKEINHQWSKSIEFERLFQRYADSFLSPDIVYFSLLRPWHEIRVVKQFIEYPKYFPVFSSCNRHVRIWKERPSVWWCGECPKCAFVFLMLSAFLSGEELVGIFGRNLYDDEALLPMFRDILGLGDMKPFDCVGTFEEARVAFVRAASVFSDRPVVRALSASVHATEGEVSDVFGFSDNDTLPERFRFMVADSVCILGYGREGQATERYLEAAFPELEKSVADRKDGEDYLNRSTEHELVVKTPGISPELVTMPYLTATNLFFSEARNLTIGVTGSKGKSTTVTLIHELLRAGGKSARLLGNVGHPMIEALIDAHDPDEIFVIELSSFQLEDIRYAPDIAVALNLFPEHLDRHGDAESYYDAKRNITMFQNADGTFVYDRAHPRLREWARRTKATPVSFSDIPIDEYETSLAGQHNRMNIRAAVAVAQRLGVSDTAIRETLRSFQPLRHRLEYLGAWSGIRFFDDAISTTPESTIAALETVPDVDTIFLGGEDRGYDFSALEETIRRKGVRNVVLFPDSGTRILSDRTGFQVLETESMKEAVAFAFSHTAPGGACLLSMASPSYSLWKDFEEKGDLFRTCVRDEGGFEDSETAKHDSDEDTGAA